jgi:hypothetical protein
MTIQRDKFYSDCSIQKYLLLSELSEKLYTSNVGASISWLRIIQNFPKYVFLLTGKIKSQQLLGFNT